VADPLFVVKIDVAQNVLPPDPSNSWDSLIERFKDHKYFKMPLEPRIPVVRSTRNNNPNHDPDSLYKKTKKKQKMNTNEDQIVDSINQPREQANAVRWGDVRTWWAAWWGGKQGGNKGIWTDLYNDIKKLGRIQAFFQSFTADAYVVSANFHQNSHPNVEVLVGLAWALREMGRFATLYVTNPASFKKEDFLSMCRYVNLDTNVLGTNLIIRYPYREHTMSLTANPPVTPEDLNERGIVHIDDKQVPRNAAGNFVSGIHDVGRTTRVLEEVGPGEDWAVFCRTRDVKLENVSAWDAMLRSTATVFELQSVDAQRLQYVTLSERHPGMLDFEPTLTATPTQLRVRESYEKAVNNNNMNALSLSKTPMSDDRSYIWVERVGARTDSLYQFMWRDENDVMKAFYLNNGQLNKDNVYANVGRNPALFRFSTIQPQFVQMIDMNFANMTLSNATTSSAGSVNDLNVLNGDDGDDYSASGGVGGIASGAGGSITRQAASGNMLYSSRTVSKMVEDHRWWARI
jgi:hypothetical protein